MKLGSFLELALLLLVIAVPIAGAESATGKMTLASPVTSTTLEGVSWSLDSYLSTEGQTENVLNYTQITALFESGRLSGHGGCNNYAGSYVTEGSNINISQLLSTMMFCYDNISSQESVYLLNLQNSATYSISDSLLKMMDANGTVILTYSVLQPLPLVGTNWSMLNYNNGREAVVGALTGTEVTAMFGADGNLTGTAGCNQYRTGFKVDGNNITIEPAATTRMACPEPEGVMDQEAEFLRALENAATYKIDRQQLWLRYENESIAAIFENAAAI